MRRMTISAPALGALLLASTAAVEAAPQAPTVSVREAGAGAYIVAASFEVPHPPSVAFDVLTDYANIPRFVPDVRRSIVLERDGGKTRVEQEAVSKFLMFSKTVHLRLAIVEEGGRISFVDECGRSFTRYAGSWHLTEESGFTRVVYELTAHPAFEVPDFLVARVLGRDAKDMIERLRSEMNRRASGTR
jgi:ribosome-associated toxin RatA of RatAB toxin-antitoxin module